MKKGLEDIKEQMREIHKEGSLIANDLERQAHNMIA